MPDIMQRTSSIFYFTTTFFNIVYFVLKQHVLMPIEIFLILFKIFHQLNVKVVPTLPDRYTALSIGKIFLPQEENVSCFFVVVIVSVTLLESDFHPQLILWQLKQSDLQSHFVVRSRLDPGSDLSAGLQVVIQSNHLQRDCRPLLILNSHRSNIFFYMLTKQFI